MAIASALLPSVTTLAGNSARHATLSPHLFKHELLNCRRRNLASTTALSAPRPPPEPSDGSDPERIPDWDQAWQIFNQKDSKEERETVTEEVALLRAGRKSQSDREDSGIRSNAESSGWSEATDRDDGPRLTQVKPTRVDSNSWYQSHGCELAGGLNQHIKQSVVVVVVVHFKTTAMGRHASRIVNG